MKKIFIYAFFLIGFVSILFSSIIWFRKPPLQDSDLITINRDSYLFEIKTNGGKINNFFLRNINDDTLSLKKIIEHGKFIIYNPKVSCQPCLDSMVTEVTNVLPEIENDIIILSRFYSLRDIKFYSLKNNNTKIPIYDILSINQDSELDKMNRSVAFMCDSTLTIKSMYVYKPENRKFLVEYLLYIKESINAKSL